MSGEKKTYSPKNTDFAGDTAIAAGYANHREETNHLGNVLAVVSDRKIAVEDQGNPGTVEYYEADVVSAQDYYPFGMIMPGRSVSSGEYRYKHQGQESDDEIYGVGNSYAYSYRMSDPRLGRMWSIDPLFKEFPWNSPYSFSENRVIDGVEMEGLQFQSIHSSMYRQTYLGQVPVLVNENAYTLRQTYGVSIVEDNVPEDYVPTIPNVRVTATGQDKVLDFGTIDNPQSVKQPSGPLPGDDLHNKRTKRRGAQGGGIELLTDGLNFIAGFDEKMAGIEEIYDRSAFYRATNLVDIYLDKGMSILPQGVDFSEGMQGQARADLINYLNDGTTPKVDDSEENSGVYRHSIIARGNQIIENTDHLDYQEDNPYKGKYVD